MSRAIPLGRRVAASAQCLRTPDNAEGLCRARVGLGSLTVLHRTAACTGGVEEADESADVDLLARWVEDVDRVRCRQSDPPGDPRPCPRPRQEMGRPDHRLATLQQSTAGLMLPMTPRSAAFTRYSDAGFERPDGLKPP